MTSPRRVLISRHVVFNESDFPYSTSSTISSDLELYLLFATDPVVQPSLPVCPFPADFPGTPAPAERTAQVQGKAPRSEQDQKHAHTGAPRAAPVPSPAPARYAHAGAGVPASFGADTGVASGSGGSCDAYTGAVTATGSLSSRAGGVPPASHPSGFSAYPSHGDSADVVLGRDSLRHRGRAASLSSTLLCPRRLGGSSLASRDGRGVRGSSCQPDVRPRAASVWLQCGDWQLDLDA